MPAQAAAASGSPSIFGLKAASRLMLDVIPPWTQELGLLIESVEAVRPFGAAADWNPGAVLRLPFSRKVTCDGKSVSPQALMAFADAAAIFACAAAWNGYRPMAAVDQTSHFVAPVRTDVLADARVVRAGVSICFCRVSIANTADMKPVAMVMSAFAMT
jgi:acyl-coenzyme A thioesterase PaaI-like protein